MEDQTRSKEASRIAYMASVHAGGTDLLLGGVRVHRSSYFASRADCAAWAETVLKTNREAGRDAAFAIVDDVRISGSTKVIPESDTL